MLASYPSWYQNRLQRAAFDVLSDDTWLLESHRPLVRNARTVSRGTGLPLQRAVGVRVRLRPEDHHVGEVLREAGSACQKADVLLTPSGDGMIPEVSGVLAGAEIHPVKQHHGSLYADKDVKMRLKLELTRALSHS